jgi:hypothetical protein
MLNPIVPLGRPRLSTTPARAVGLIWGHLRTARDQRQILAWLLGSWLVLSDNDRSRPLVLLRQLLREQLRGVRRRKPRLRMRVKLCLVLYLSQLQQSS